MKRITALFLTLVLALTPLMAQSPAPSRDSRVAGVFVAANYGKWQAKIAVGSASTGAVTYTLASGSVTLPDGRVIVPFATTAPLLIGSGANAETVTPSAVSGCVKGGQPNTCTITVSVSNAHGQGDVIQSGTFGLQEAVNDSDASGDGLVVCDSDWEALGGVASTITSAATAKTGVFVQFNSGGSIITYGKSSTSFVAVQTVAATGQTLVAPVISGGLTASGSAANDFSASTGAFKSSTGAGTFGGSSNTFTGASPQLTLGISGTTAAGIKLLNGTSGDITLAPVTGALGTKAITIPATTGTMSLAIVAPCAAAGASCTETVTQGTKSIYGISGSLNGASPSVAVVTFSTGFTSSSSNSCVANGKGTTAAIAAAGIAISYTSATQVTFTSANAGNWAVSFRCIGT